MKAVQDEGGRKKDRPATQTDRARELRQQAPRQSLQRTRIPAKSRRGLVGRFAIGRSHAVLVAHYDRLSYGYT
jgi:hypothetical protein